MLSQGGDNMSDKITINEFAIVSSAEKQIYGAKDDSDIPYIIEELLHGGNVSIDGPRAVIPTSCPDHRETTLIADGEKIEVYIADESGKDHLKHVIPSDIDDFEPFKEKYEKSMGIDSKEPYSFNKFWKG